MGRGGGSQHPKSRQNTERSGLYIFWLECMASTSQLCPGSLKVPLVSHGTRQYCQESSLEGAAWCPGLSGKLGRSADSALSGVLNGVVFSNFLVATTVPRGLTAVSLSVVRLAERVADVLSTVTSAIVLAGLSKSNYTDLLSCVLEGGWLDGWLGGREGGWCWVGGPVGGGDYLGCLVGVVVMAVAGGGGDQQPTRRGAVRAPAEGPPNHSCRGSKPGSGQPSGSFRIFTVKACR